MKRFYQQAAPTEGEGGFGVTLDGRPVKTPAKRPLIVPTASLAAALAEEWQGQGDKIEPARMPLMQLVSTAIDRIAVNSAPLLDYLTGFGRSDLLCYRAAHPADLAARQAQAWQPWLDWAAERHGVALAVAEGIVPIEQPAASIERLRAILAGYDFWRLTALQSLVPALASAVLGLAVAERALAAEAAFELAQLDEIFQAERWGLDADAARRQSELRREVAAAARFLDLLTNTS
jgi:chaperone required for assembly of F1-ATPase